MFPTLSRDLARCGTTRAGRAREVLCNTGMWPVLVYRFRRWVFTECRPAIVRKPLGMLGTLLGIAAEVATNITLPPTAGIGPGLYIAHTGYVVLSSGVVIGANCTLTQGVTIGHGGGGAARKGGSPVLGDRVYVGPGAIVIGPITIGDDALIGAGAVVTRAVPPRGVVAGNPARLLSRRGSFDLIDYPGMDDDPARLASLAACAAEAGEPDPVAAPTGA